MSFLPQDTCHKPRDMSVLGITPSSIGELSSASPPNLLYQAGITLPEWDKESELSRKDSGPSASTAA